MFFKLKCILSTFDKKIWLKTRGHRENYATLTFFSFSRTIELGRWWREGPKWQWKLQTLKQVASGSELVCRKEVASGSESDFEHLLWYLHFTLFYFRLCNYGVWFSSLNIPLFPHLYKPAWVKSLRIRR